MLNQRILYRAFTSVETIYKMAFTPCHVASTKVKSVVSLETKFHAIQDFKDKKDSYSLVMQHFGSGVKHDPLI